MAASSQLTYVLRLVRARLVSDVPTLCPEGGRDSPKGRVPLISCTLAGRRHMLSRTRTLPSQTDFEPSSATLPHPASSETCGGARAVNRICIVCRKRFTAKRAEAKACSGRCRMQASRNRRLTELVERLERAELALANANIALAAVRELAAIGISRVAP